MKKTILSPLLPVILLLVQPSFAQNQDLLSAVSANQPAHLVSNRTARFPDLGKYLNEQLQYPEMARKNSVEGSVSVEALIGEQGDVLSVVLVDGIGFGCDELVLEMVSNMPQWTPAIKNGRSVAQKVLIRAHFRLK